MTNNNHRNSDCDYAEQLVSYLYGESDATEKAAFERHLIKCSACADESEAFADLKFSLGDWKTREFDVLAAPTFEIPYHEKQVLQEKGSWLSAVRGFFAFSPRAYSLAAASFAVLAICAGLFIFKANRNDSELFAEGNTKLQKSPTPSNKDAVSSNNVAAVSTPDAPKNERKKSAGSKSNESIVAVQNEQKQPRVVKIVNNPRPAQMPEASRKNDPFVKKDNKSKQLPRVIEDDDEDKSLRLAELFDEIDSK